MKMKLEWQGDMSQVSPSEVQSVFNAILATLAKFEEARPASIASAVMLVAQTLPGNFIKTV